MATDSPLDLIARAVFDRVADGDAPELALAAELGELEPEPAELSLALRRVASRNVDVNPPIAYEIARLAVYVALKADAEREAAIALSTCAEALQSLGRTPAVLRVLDHALSRFRSVGDEQLIAETQAKSVMPLTVAGRFDEARRVGDEAFAAFERLDSDRGRIQVANELGLLELRLDRPRRAMGYFQAAFALVDPDRLPSLAGVLRNNQALCLERLQRYRASTRYADVARGLLAAAGRDHSVGVIDGNRAYIASRRGLYAEAMALFDRAGEVLTPEQSGEHSVILQLDRAEMHLEMGMPRAARSLALQALEQLTTIGGPIERAKAQFFVGLAAMVEGTPLAATEPLVAARELFETVGNGVWVAECDLLRARAALTLGNHYTAHDHACRARDGFLAAQRVTRSAAAEVVLAQLELYEGRAADALARLDTVVHTLPRYPAPWVELELTRYRAMCLRELGRHDEAIPLLEAAVEIVERHREGVPADEFMVAFLSSKLAVYSETVDALVGRGHTEKAFEYSERAHSRALLDMLSTRGAGGIGSHRADFAFASMRVRRLREQIRVLRGELHRLPAPADDPHPVRRRERLQERAVEKEARLAEALREAWRRDPEFASLHAVDARSLESIQALLDDDTTLLEYLVTERRTYVFAVQRRKVLCWNLPVGEAQLRAKALQLQFHLAKFNLGTQYTERHHELLLAATNSNLRDIADLLVERLVRSLDTRRLVIVPHGPLHGIPFHALPLGDGSVFDRFDVRYAPSGAVYGFCGEKTTPATGSSSVFALPDQRAPSIREEAVAVCRAIGGRTRAFVGDSATFERFRDCTKTSRILHVATHATFRKEQPMVSSIRLADRWLNLYDIYGLEIGADLVVLSACETGSAHVSGSDDALGLVRGFLYAGAPRLLVSRWRVHDAATAHFMGVFYTSCRSNRDYEAAYRAAMASVRTKHPHPYFWAPFFLVGFPAGSAPRVPSGPTRFTLDA